MEFASSSALEPRQKESVENMKKNSVEIQPSYDFSPSKRIEQPYKQRLVSNPERRITVHPTTPTLQAPTTVTLEPDLAAAFPDGAAVNAALRQFLKISEIMRVGSKKRGKRAA